MLTWEPETRKPIPVTLTMILFGNVIQLNKVNTKELPATVLRPNLLYGSIIHKLHVNLFVLNQRYYSLNVCADSFQTA